MGRQKTWTLADHLCRDCGGRILQSATGAGMTPGGNPIYRCADCGVSCCGMTPNGICWCGYHPRQNHGSRVYQCLPFSILEERPGLRVAFAQCGHDPTRGEVGVVLSSSLAADAAITAKER